MRVPHQADTAGRALGRLEWAPGHVELNGGALRWIALSTAEADVASPPSVDSYAGTMAVQQALLHDHLSWVEVKAAVGVNQAMATAMRSRSHRLVPPVNLWNPEMLVCGHWLPERPGSRQPPCPPPDARRTCTS